LARTKDDADLVNYVKCEYATRLFLRTLKALPNRFKIRFFQNILKK
jgi:hypothetical protein